MRDKNSKQLHLLLFIVRKMIETFTRNLLDLWGLTGIAPGRYYQVFESLSKYLFSPTTVVSFLPNQCQMFCNLQDHVQRQIYFLGVYEPVEAYLYSCLVKPGMTVIDVGANVGQYSLLASTIVGNGGAVHSFEPVPATFVQLSSNVKVNELMNVHLNQTALWKESTTLKLSLSPAMADNIGSYSVGITNQDTAVESASIRLDEYAASKTIKKIDLIKMDIEGAEFAALLGMQDILERDHPIILIEINRLALQEVGYDPEDIWNLLVKKFNYIGYLIEIDSCRRISCFSGIQQKNVLFIHKLNTFNIVNNSWSLKYILRWARSGKNIFCIKNYRIQLGF